jgi:arsenite transporter
MSTSQHTDVRSAEAVEMTAFEAEAELKKGAARNADDKTIPPSRLNEEDDGPAAEAMGIFEKYLSIWVVTCMVIGSLIGYYQPSVAETLAQAQFAQINGIVAALLWGIIVPMLLQIDVTSLLAVRDNPAAISLTSVINYVVKPFTMYGECF